jgi:glycosyltransferase involved in cell wall biosynthesis
MLDQDRYSPGPPEFRPTWQEKIGGDFFVMQTARLDEFYKKSSVAIEGFAKFARKCPGARLIVLSWGKDEKAGRERLSELGVEEQCLFIPASGKRRLIRYLRSADCLLDQFRLGYYGATGLEALACGVPVIMRIEQSQYEAQNETGAPPVLQSETADEVAAHLERLYTDRRHRRAVGKASRQWFLANHGSKKWAPVYRDMLIALASGHRFDFSQSPLQQPQSKAETDYLARELKKAPVFPNYQ